MVGWMERWKQMSMSAMLFTGIGWKVYKTKRCFKSAWEGFENIIFLISVCLRYIQKRQNRSLKLHILIYHQQQVRFDVMSKVCHPILARLHRVCKLYRWWWWRRRRRSLSEGPLTFGIQDSRIPGIPELPIVHNIKARFWTTWKGRNKMVFLLVAKQHKFSSCSSEFFIGTSGNSGC